VSTRSPLADRVVVRSVTAAALAATASCFTVLGWSGLAADPSGYVRPLVLVAVGVALLGVLLRSVGAPRPLVVALQTLGVAEALHVWWAGDLAVGGWLPTSESIGEVGATLGRAVTAAQEWAAPVPERVTAFDPLMIAIGVLVILLVDAFGVTYRRATLAGLPLLAAFTLPAAVTGGMRWDHFVPAAGAFLLLVAAEQLHTVGRWGRSLGTGAGGPIDATPPTTADMLVRNRGALVRVIAPSLLLAVAGSLAVPDDTGLLGRGSGGSGSGEVSIENPITDLRRDLVQGPDVNLLMVRTDDPDPSYLRISALDSFDGNTWRPSRRDLPPSQRVDGELPDPVGLGEGVAQERHRYEISASGAMQSEWLPLPFPAVAADAPGDWRYSEGTLDVTTIDEDLDTADLDYDAVRLRVIPTAPQLVDAPDPPAGISGLNTELPFDEGVPSWLGELVTDVTAGAESDFAQGVALQDWFRDPANFTYSTERAAGNGLDDLRTFLTPGPDGRVGYCEQFASAMAVMARVAGIPARVAVGFLQPDAALGPGSWVFSAHDLHSWPELFFSGVGWVRFEPTPADQAPSVPGYTAAQLPRLDEETQSTESASAPSASRELRAEDPIETGDAGTQTEGTSWWWLAPVVLPLAALLLLVPRLVRTRHRRLRGRASALGGDRAAEAAWDEVRATVLDLGHDWDDRTTLRGQQRRLLQLLHRAPVGSRASGSAVTVPVDQLHAAVRTVVGAVEQARFSAIPLSEQQGREAWSGAGLVTHGLWDRTERQQRRRATWWPRSLRVGAAPDPGPGSRAGTEDQARSLLEDNVSV
jgi:transglutaminase-like putative cysteine protease